MTTIPLLGTGTFRLKDQLAFDSVLMALKQGSRHIDTAQIYANEKQVGDAINASGIARADIFLTNKVWTDRFAHDQLIQSVNDSLALLQTDYVDLLLIHWPLRDDSVPMREYLLALKEVQDAGLAKHIGVSNFTIAQVTQAIEILGADAIFTNQVEVHPYLQNNRLVKFCQQHNIMVTGYMPFAYGAVLTDDTIVAIAKKHQMTPAQAVLVWMRQKGYVTIPSSTKLVNVQANMASLALSLPSEDMAAIDKLDRNHRVAAPDFSPDWDQ
ncbi:2,5-didehydrogluconate reductase DkgB [Shewanella sp. SR41-2]|nr:2,5-didehydrogluconate reductase DkgB [Shewanella sp. SR41-2]